jgi:hypothetical protein
MIDPELPELPARSVPNRMLRQFACLWIVFFGILAFWQGWLCDHPITAAVLASVGGVIGLLGLVKPGAMRPIYRGGILIGFPIGWVVSNLLLSLLFFLMFTPLGLLLRLIRRDPLCLQHNPDLSSYWTRKPMPSNVTAYFRQS